ncbi:hypothetical protein [uncultured Mediterranean phage uvDeep-CGR2-KM18-C269]|nr:hypothetical protein [uncultured Mediterranean phage uvDeep-CGR2-KM18-C269]
MNSHSFPTEIADELGLHEALFLQHFFYWHKRNEGNNKNLIDGHYWTYNSIAGFSAIFTYISTYTIRNTLKKLEKEGYILTANHNKKKYDRTTWYALTEKSLSYFNSAICRNPQMHLSKTENGFVDFDKPIPDSNTNSNNNINISFNSFWDLYDKKINAGKCKLKWKTLKDQERDDIMKHVASYILSTPDKQFRKNPLTYLNNDGWNDEVMKTKKQLIEEEEKIKKEKEMVTLICPQNHKTRTSFRERRGTIKFCPACRTKMETASEIRYLKLIGLAN